MFGDGSGLMSDVYSFKAAPPTGPGVTVRVVAYGGTCVSACMPNDLHDFVLSCVYVCVTGTV